jgi:hypothetical protein
MVVAAVRELHVKVTSGIAHQARHPHNGIAATQKRQHFIRVMHVHLASIELRVGAKGAYRIIAKPLRVNACDLKPLINQVSTQGTS